MTPQTAALILGDLQNDFLHPEGAYGRAGQSNPTIAALPEKLTPLVRAARMRGLLVVATLFTLVPGRGGEPIISPHLKTLRPFLAKRDFAPGSWGQRLVDALAPVDIEVEKIAYSAFHASRLEWVLRKCGIEQLYFAPGSPPTLLHVGHRSDGALDIAGGGDPTGAELCGQSARPRA